MKTTLQLGDRRITIKSVYFEGLFSELWETNRERFNEFSKGAIQKFVSKLTPLWGSRNWTVINGAPIVAEGQNLRDYTNLIVGAAWLDSWSGAKNPDADGSHAFVVWTQKPDIEISLQDVLSNHKWANISEDYEL